MEVLASFARESMVASRIGVELEGWCGQTRPHSGLTVPRDEPVFLRDVEQRRFAGPDGLTKVVVDPDAIIAHGRIRIGPCVGEEGQEPAEAVADSPDLRMPLRARPGDCGGDILDAFVDVERLEAVYPCLARSSVMSRITLLTPKISWMTTMAGPSPLLPSATYAPKDPSFPWIVILRPMVGSPVLDCWLSGL
jgi:hypothetical protein